MRLHGNGCSLKYLERKRRGVGFGSPLKESNTQVSDQHEALVRAERSTDEKNLEALTL
jgi:hypothetical protein